MLGAGTLMEVIDVLGDERQVALVQTAKAGHIPANSPFAEANSDAEHG